MYIIVVGGGRVGYHLVKALLEESHEVLLIEKSPTICQNINDELGSVCTNGDGCEVATLAEVGTARANMFVAVTGDDEDNLVACQVAKYKFKVPRTIARLRNPKNEALFKSLGVDVTVSTTSLILEAIEREVPTHPLTHLLTLKERGLVIVDVRVPPESQAVGKMIKDLLLPPDSSLLLIVHKTQRPLVPSPYNILRAEDQIIAVTVPEAEEELKKVLRGG